MMKYEGEAGPCEPGACCCCRVWCAAHYLPQFGVVIAYAPRNLPKIYEKIALAVKAISGKIVVSCARCGPFVNIHCHGPSYLDAGVDQITASNMQIIYL